MSRIRGEGDLESGESSLDLERRLFQEMSQGVLIMELLEERSDILIVLRDDRVLVLEKNPYNLLKYKYYQGRKIRFLSNSEGRLSLEETDQDGIFLSTHHGVTLTIEGSHIEVARAILETQSKGNLSPLLSLWKLKYFEKFLDIRVILGSSPLELTHEGRLLLPKSVSLRILEWLERYDGGRVAKVELSRDANSPVDRIFTHELQMKDQTKILVNKTALLLVGRDETGQCWMHVLPPEYRSRTISSCEEWLCGVEDGKDELVGP